MKYVTNGELLDVLEVGPEALIFVDEKLIRGSVVTVDLCWLCQEPRSLDELAQHCLSAFGAPPGGTVEESTMAAVQSLLDNGVLKEVPE